MFRTLIAVVVVGSLMVGANALAQRDAGAKARREIGQGFWSTSARTSNPQTRQRVATPRYTPRNTPNYVGVKSQSSRSYQSFSYVPAPGGDGSGKGDDPTKPIAGEQVERDNAESQNDPGPSPCTQSPTASYRRFSYEPAATAAARSVTRDKSVTRQQATPPQVRLRPGSGRF